MYKKSPLNKTTQSVNKTTFDLLCFSSSGVEWCTMGKTRTELTPKAKLDLLKRYRTLALDKVSKRDAAKKLNISRTLLIKLLKSEDTIATLAETGSSSKNWVFRLIKPIG